MRRAILLITAMTAAWLLAGGLVLFSGVGQDGPAVVQAQTTPDRQQNGLRVKGAPFRAQGRGVSVRPEEIHRQVAPTPRREAAAPPLILTKEGKAALERARRGEVRPTTKDKIEVPEAAPSEPQPETPALGKTFLGSADTGWIPPDTQIAAGPNNVMVVVNGAVNIYDKDGFLRSSQTLGGFFSPLGAEHSQAFDPWAVYDPYINRFWLLAASKDDTTQRSDILIGLSDTQDATLSWRLWEQDATVDGTTDTSNWCDYPKLGFDAQAIYVTCNMFTFPDSSGRKFFRYTKARVMAKSQFINNSGIFGWDFWDKREGDVSTNNAVMSMQPAKMFGASDSDGEFLIDAQGRGGTGDTFDVWRITNAQECCNGDNIGPTMIHQSQSLGSYGPSLGGRQSGSTARLHTGDTRLQYAFWQGGKLATGQNMACGTDGADTCASFTELDVSSFPTITTLNDWVLTSSGVDYFYPAVVPNASGNRTMVLSRSSPSEFASALFVGIPPSSQCTSCLDSPLRFLEDEGNTYVRLDGDRDRWGDYSGASPDPNGQGIWIAGEFARDTANTWGVQAGLTYQDSPPAANDNFFRAQTITGYTTRVSGSTRFATREPIEPTHLPSSGRLGEHSVWYNWMAPFSGQVEMNTCTSDFDTVLAVYTGSSFGTLSQVANDDDSCTPPDNEFASRLAFRAVAGTTYRIAVGSFSSDSEGLFTLRVLDRQAPRVVRVVPEEDATGIAPGDNVKAVFSEPMDPGTINTTTVELFKAGTTTAIGATVSYDAAHRRATLNPNANLRLGTKYKAVVTTGAKDWTGNQLDQEPNVAGNQQKVWFFKVRS